MVTRIIMRTFGVIFLLTSALLVGCSTSGSYLGALIPGAGFGKSAQVNDSRTNISAETLSAEQGDESPDQAAGKEAAGLRLLSLGKTTQAESMLRSALAEDSSLVAAREGLGLIYIDQDNYSLAETMFMRVLEAQPERHSAMNALGVLYDLQERFSESEKNYLAAIAANPRVPKYFNNLGYSYYLQGKYDAAKKEFNNAVNLDPGFVTAWGNLALVNASTGDQAGAGQSLEMIGERHVAQNNLGYLNLFVNKNELARENFISALTMAPQDYPKARQNMELMNRRSYATSNLSQPRSTVMHAASSLLQDIHSLPDAPAGQAVASTSLSSEITTLVYASERGPEWAERKVERPVTPSLPSKAITPSALKADSSPVTVKAIQARLLDLGFHPDPVDGKMGDKTVLAIRLYKLAKRLPVDAEVTDELINALEL